MRNNDWVPGGAEADIICPPQQRSLEVRYRNGDYLRVEYRTFLSHIEYERETNCRLPKFVFEDFPLTVAYLEFQIAELDLQIGKNAFEMGGLSVSGGCFKELFRITDWQVEELRSATDLLDDVEFNFGWFDD